MAVLSLLSGRYTQDAFSGPERWALISQTEQPSWRNAALLSPKFSSVSLAWQFDWGTSRVRLMCVRTDMAVRNHVFGMYGVYSRTIMTKIVRKSCKSAYVCPRRKRTESFDTSNTSSAVTDAGNWTHINIPPSGKSHLTPSFPTCDIIMLCAAFTFSWKSKWSNLRPRGFTNICEKQSQKAPPGWKLQIIVFARL